MKKLIISSLVFVMIIVGCVNVFAVEGDSTNTGTDGTETTVESIPTATASFENYDLEITANPADAKLGERITVTVKALNFKNVEDGVKVIMGTLRYDDKVLRLVEYSAPAGWDTLEFNSETNQFVTATSEYTKEDLTILTLVFQPLTTAKVGDTADITLEYLDLSNDNDYEVTENAPVVKVKIVEETTDPGTEDPGTEDPGTEKPGTEKPGTKDPSDNDTQTPGTQKPGNGSNGGSTGTNNGSNGQTTGGSGNRVTYGDGTTATGKLPYTGRQVAFISVVGIALVTVAIISLRKYKELKGIK